MQSKTDHKPSLPTPVFLKDYCPPFYLIPHTQLRFDLEEHHTTVTNLMYLERAAHTPQGTPLFLNGENLKCKKVLLNGEPIPSSRLQINNQGLTLFDPPPSFRLEIETEIDPALNKSGEGLYRSGSLFCTQMEAEGFRHVTFFIDRPDVLSRFTTTVTADKRKYPVLLSNGNLSQAGDLPHGKHFTVWVDPFPKPCYLFALVAGNLVCLEDRFITKSKRAVCLRIFAEKGNESRCTHAMESLKKAMAWDEEVFGLEYDLDLYMIVAVSDFNFGAMENKGLNIFNAAYILADPQSATDQDYTAIERVVAHEYFHNWTGNRVTCRDWFQLTLKEGLTVFRDQLFCADMGAREAKRIQEAHHIKTVQFLEDSGPNAHPIKPDSYIEINNFYTQTVYAKGAEVIRMVDTLIGRRHFVCGLQKYFELYDGQAVTTEDFLHAMERASGFDFSQFKRWYHQAGTPLCEVEGRYLPAEEIYELRVRQSCPPTPGQPSKAPFYFPLSMGLLDPAGRELELRLEGERAYDCKTKILHICEHEHVFRFTGIKAVPVPSLLRGFSAPVKLKFAYKREELELLLRHDPDGYVRYEASQRLILENLDHKMQKIAEGQTSDPDSHLAEVILCLMEDTTLDPALRTTLATLPPLSSVVELTEPLDHDRAKKALDELRFCLCATGKSRLEKLYGTLTHELGPIYKRDPGSMGMRSLKNLCLAYLAAAKNKDAISLSYGQFRSGSCMTDVYAALMTLCHTGSQEMHAALEEFCMRWRHDSLVMDKWFAVQAAADLPDVLENVQRLEKHLLFDRFNPNKLRALYLTFASNLPYFHDKYGRGYSFIAEKILEIDKYNSNVAARLASAFARYQRMDPERKRLMRENLSRVLSQPGLSRGVFEIVSKTLKEGENI